MDRVDRLEQGKGERALTDAVFILLHDPGIGDLVDQHKGQIVSRETPGGVAAHAAPRSIRHGRPDDQVDQRLQHLELIIQMKSEARYWSMVAKVVLNCWAYSRSRARSSCSRFMPPPG